jgi:hypothetical protein
VFDTLLEWFVIIGPTAFAIGLEIVDEKIRKRPHWRSAVVVFGIILSGCTFWQIQSQNTKAEAASGVIRDQGRKIDHLQSTVDGYGPKLDDLIEKAKTPEQKAAAEQLKRELSPPLENVTNVRLDDMALTDIQRLTSAGGGWCNSDAQWDDGTRDVLIRSGHPDANGKFASASKQELAKIQKSRDARKASLIDVKQSQLYQDLAAEASELEIEMLSRLDSAERLRVQPDGETKEVFVRLKKGAYGCRDFEKAQTYLRSLEQEFVNFIHR